MALTPYRAEKIVESYNLFLNTDDATRDGQNYNFEFGNNALMTRNKDQYIRLTLLNFNMYKNWTDVNSYNSGLMVKKGGVYAPVTIAHQNYASLHDLATAFGNALLPAIDTVLGGTASTLTGTATLPPASAGIAGTSANIISVTINKAAHGVTQANVTSGDFQLAAIIDPANDANLAGLGLLQGADAALLLGGDRIAAGSTDQSFIVTIVDVDTIKVTAKYPGQRSSEPNIYLRINPAPQIFASEAFQTPLTTSGENRLNPSTILAEVKIDTEFVQYNPQSDKEFFINMYQPAINHFNIQLTDSRNRPLPFLTGQEIKGNRFFTATLRVDIVQDVAYGQASAAHIQIPHKFPARFDSNLLEKHKNGQSNYNRPPGF